MSTSRLSARSSGDAMIDPSITDALRLLRKAQVLVVHSEACLRNGSGFLKTCSCEYWSFMLETQDAIADLQNHIDHQNLLDNHGAS